RNTASRRLNPHNDLTSFKVALQCARNSNGALTFDKLDINNYNMSIEQKGAYIYHGETDCYYNVDLISKRPPSPILYSIYDTFWLFGPANVGSRVYDVSRTFDDLIN
ncbi:MAG: hypothetical protein EZS28_016875, partial [Streblomastix strix]